MEKKNTETLGTLFCIRGLNLQAIRLGEKDAAIRVTADALPDVEVEVSVDHAIAVEWALQSIRKDIERAAK